MGEINHGMYDENTTICVDVRDGTGAASENVEGLCVVHHAKQLVESPC